VNLDLKAGQVHAIMGPNGSGKSTLASVLIGRDGYDVSGSVTYEGRIYSRSHPRNGLRLVYSWPSSIRWKFPVSATCISCARP
jgi:Fe-S cluster assembly ATPase SufC